MLMRTHRGGGRRAILLIAVLAAFAAPSSADERPALAVVVTAPGQTGFWRIDVASGDRTPHDIAVWPIVMAVHQATVLPAGDVVIEATSALQTRNLLRFDPHTGELRGISGWVDPASDETRGDGPGLEPGAVRIVALPGGPLLLLRQGAGLMRVDLDSGDRAVVSQSVEPARGTGWPLLSPVDLVLESDDTALVAEQFEGIVRVRLSDGARALLHPATSFPELPTRIARLPDARLVHVHGETGSDALHVFDPASGLDRVLSGRGQGEGEPFGAIADVVLGPDGRLYVYDLNPPTLFAVDPTSGDRVVVSGGREGRGVGLELPTVFDRPRLATFSPAARLEPVRPIRRRLGVLR